MQRPWTRHSPLLAMANVSSPEYLALRKKFDVISDAVSGFENTHALATKLLAKGVIGNAVFDTVEAAINAGQNPARVAGHLMQPTLRNISFQPDYFYKLVDALKECELLIDIEEILVMPCRKSYMPEVISGTDLIDYFLYTATH